MTLGAWASSRKGQDVSLADPPQPIAAPRRGRPRRLAPDDQRRRALGAARALLDEAGYGATTMDGVARRARLSKKTLYEIFASKAQLVAALVEEHRRSLLALPHEGDDPPDVAIRRIFRVDTPEAEALQRDGLIRLIMAESGAFPELRDILVAHGPRVAHADLAAWIATQAARGILDVPDPRLAAGVLLDMMFGAMMHRAPHSEGSDRAARIEAAIAIFVRGAGYLPPAGASQRR
ncbi:TetR/AcrR family transcriptional regulator [Phreatobacter cathodiphilus]|uniref:TetR/AcrR family transcriptional regulator n=1 Tax=Phreatobacter cathodiphilus TaxID=1868589 RepID=A0A2S0NCR0_9HYPH|nr:TetR/AcrR family transcriptional regulator [Phreatobacter cathodiphilus]